MISLDALVGDVVELHRRAEGEPGEDRHLRRGVGAADVLGRVGLGVAELLGLRQRRPRRRAPLRAISVRMKLVVPLTIPKTFSIAVAPRLSWITRITGIDARRPRPRSAAATPRLARGREQLVAVLGEQLLVGGDHVACPPAARAARSRAPGRSRRSARRRCRCAARISSKSPSLRRRTPATSGRRPVTSSTIVGALRRAARAKAPPTVPVPEERRRRTGLGHHTSRADQVVVGLAADDDPRLAVAAEDHRRPRHAVVVVGHRVAVGAGRRGDQHVADARGGQRRVADQDVAGLAVHAGDRRQRVAASRRRGRRSPPRSGSRRASAAGCRTCRRRRRRRCARPGSP